MEDEKRKQVVQMLADIKSEVAKKCKSKAPSAKKSSNTQSDKKKGGAELVYIKLDSQEGLAEALNAITRIKGD